MNLCAVILVVVVAFVHSGFALDCYECDAENYACADPFTAANGNPITCPSTHQQASAGASANSGYGDHGQGHAQGQGGQSQPKGKSDALCYKAVVKTHDDQYKIYRGCGNKNQDACQQFVQQGDSLYACKTCHGDRCNSAPRHLSITLSLLMVAPLMVLINKF